MALNRLVQYDAKGVFNKTTLMTNDTEQLGRNAAAFFWFTLLQHAMSTSVGRYHGTAIPQIPRYYRTYK